MEQSINYRFHKSRNMIRLSNDIRCFSDLLFIASAVTGPMAAYKGLSESSGLQNPPACLNARTPEGLANISTRHNDSCSSIRFEGTPFTA